MLRVELSTKRDMVAGHDEAQSTAEVYSQTLQSVN